MIIQYQDNTHGKWVTTEEGGRKSVGWQAPILFTCEAGSLTEADKLFEKTTGILAAKNPLIGASILNPQPK